MGSPGIKVRIIWVNDRLIGNLLIPDLIDKIHCGRQQSHTHNVITIVFVHSPVTERNLSHCACQKSPLAPQKFCKCLAGKSNLVNVNHESFIMMELREATQSRTQSQYVFANKYCVLLLIYLHFTAY